MMEGLLYEGGKLLGLNNEEAALAATSVIIINDLKGLKVDKVIKNVDDLIEAAGAFKKGKTRVGENTIDGDIDDVFETITDGGTTLESGAVKLEDGRIIHQHTSTATGEKTITVDQKDQRQKKIRFKTDDQ